MASRGRRGIGAAAVLVAVAAGACSSSRPHVALPSRPSAAASAPNAGVAPAPRATLAEAVRAVLDAEQRGDHAGSYALLDDEGRAEYPDVTRWRDRRNELPAVVSYRLDGPAASAAAKGSDGAAAVVALVAHKPGLDPFIGLSPAEDRETWTGRMEHGGWMVNADATSDPVLPADGGAVPSVAAWLKAAQACDSAAARTHQAVDPLLGTGNAVAQFCGRPIAFQLSPATKVTPGPASEQVVAQYNSDALVWARSVTLTGGAAPIHVVTAPIGDTWQVIGVFP